MCRLKTYKITNLNRDISSDFSKTRFFIRKTSKKEKTRFSLIGKSTTPQFIAQVKFILYQDLLF
jgi:hypothetical protein